MTKPLREIVILFHPHFVPITGSINAALLLGQIIYWNKNTQKKTVINGQEYFWHTLEQWQAETQMSKREVMYALTKLYETGIVIRELQGGRNYYRVNFSRLNELVQHSNNSGDFEENENEYEYPNSTEFETSGAETAPESVLRQHHIEEYNNIKKEKIINLPQPASASRNQEAAPGGPAGNETINKKEEINSQNENISLDAKQAAKGKVKNKETTSSKNIDCSKKNKSRARNSSFESDTPSNNLCRLFLKFCLNKQTEEDRARLSAAEVQAVRTFVKDNFIDENFTIADFSGFEDWYKTQSPGEFDAANRACGKVVRHTYNFLKEWFHEYRNAAQILGEAGEAGVEIANGLPVTKVSEHAPRAVD